MKKHITITMRRHWMHATTAEEHSCLIVLRYIWGVVIKSMRPWNQNLNKMSMEVQVWEVEVAHLKKDNHLWEIEKQEIHLNQIQAWKITHNQKERCLNWNQTLAEVVVAVESAKAQDNYHHHTNQTWNSKSIVKTVEVNLVKQRWRHILETAIKDLEEMQVWNHRVQEMVDIKWMAATQWTEWVEEMLLDLVVAMVDKGHHREEYSQRWWVKVN